MSNDLTRKLYDLLNSEAFDEARDLINQELKKDQFDTPEEKLTFQAKIYGLLIDIGTESMNESDLRQAIIFLETNSKNLETLITRSSYYYNLANAKSALAKIFSQKNVGVHPISITKEYFQEPINLYWLAHKNIGIKGPGLKDEILINLSNSLVSAARIVEGLQFLDIVLRTNPQFPQALISRGNNLEYLSKVTNCAHTISLYAQIYRSYDDGIRTQSLPPSIAERSQHYRQGMYNIIHGNGFNVNDIERELRESNKEFDNHTEFRKYCITNFLTLNEHSLYCNCIATRKDNLQIGVSHGMFRIEAVAKLELLLNRVKAEFAFARWMYYQSLQDDASFDLDVQFSELFDGECINSKVEMQRSSFRICYGILDKIASGICELYDLDVKLKYFERFWDNPKVKSQLSQIKNIHLNALYSIACDLNTSIGELKHFKEWRNKMEHNLLVLKNTKGFNLDIFQLFEDTEFVSVVDEKEFEETSLHLLQLTRAAIFSYVFCVRLQTIHRRENGLEDKSFEVGFK